MHEISNARCSLTVDISPTLWRKLDEVDGADNEVEIRNYCELDDAHPGDTHYACGQTSGDTVYWIVWSTDGGVDIVQMESCPSEFGDTLCVLFSEHLGNHWDCVTAWS